ncbi:MAG TPA: glycosyltransferase [Verrucomicrobia bacterium]|nr:MAG: glycosyltransferase [Lentisphaerae bacterium GWF2_57_35]HBA83711.1 glycosyltransferase [Verrucomicrobiota bacterium]
MKIVFFYHSLVSDWNHGHAHFLRGIATALMRRGCQAAVFEPADGWSLSNLRRRHGEAPIQDFYRRFPHLKSQFYDPKNIDLDEALHGADMVVVHEWNDQKLVKAIGKHREAGKKYVLLFHDTHHRSVTDPEGIGAYDLRHYDGVLAFGAVIRQLYLRQGWARRAWTWHEAADTSVFVPMIESAKTGDLVWIGNWGDEERSDEIDEFIIQPVSRLGLRAAFYGVRYPKHAMRALKKAGIAYGGWLPNYQVSDVFSRFRVTVHVPRRPYVKKLPGIPTIRPFEALASGIPLISAPWKDAEGLFKVGRDFLMARDGDDMTHLLQKVLGNERKQALMAAHGLRSIRARHTCEHRVDELLCIYKQLRKSVHGAQTRKEKEYARL